jgi:hypothetical protein
MAANRRLADSICHLRQEMVNRLSLNGGSAEFISLLFAFTQDSRNLVERRKKSVPVSMAAARKG